MYYIWHIILFIALVVSYLLLPKKARDKKVSTENTTKTESSKKED